MTVPAEAGTATGGEKGGDHGTAYRRHVPLKAAAAFKAPGAWDVRSTQCRAAGQAGPGPCGKNPAVAGTAVASGSTVGPTCHRHGSAAVRHRSVRGGNGCRRGVERGWGMLIHRDHREHASARTTQSRRRQSRSARLPGSDQGHRRVSWRHRLLHYPSWAIVYRQKDLICHLRNDRVAQRFYSVHPSGYPIIHSKYTGFTFWPMQRSESCPRLCP